VEAVEVKETLVDMDLVAVVLADIEQEQHLLEHHKL
jgi:hypothetical protein